MESVVALTSDEEERRGVAASLLAPLIPVEVKEAEEKWRKKILAKDENVENSPEVEGEAPSGSPALCDGESPAQSNQQSRNQSRENSDGEEETEEDTKELELALERKKVTTHLSTLAVGWSELLWPFKYEVVNLPKYAT